MLVKLARSFEHHGTRIRWAFVGLLVGGPLAWWAGSFLSCSRTINGCEARADSIEAAGTWFGSIATLLAVLIAVRAFQAEQRQQRKDQRRAKRTALEREKRIKDEAGRVQISCHVENGQGGQVRGYVISVTNNADYTSLIRLQGRDFVGPLVGKRALGVGQIASTRRRSGSWQPPPEAPITDEDAFARWCVQEVEIMFSMHGRYWRRVGHDEVELIDPWEAEGPDSAEWSHF